MCIRLCLAHHVLSIVWSNCEWSSLSSTSNSDYVETCKGNIQLDPLPLVKKCCQQTGLLSKSWQAAFFHRFCPLSWLIQPGYAPLFVCFPILSCPHMQQKEEIFYLPRRRRPSHPAARLARARKQPWRRGRRRWGGGRPANAPPPPGRGTRWRPCSPAQRGGWRGQQCGARWFGCSPWAAGAARPQGSGIC